MPREWFVESDKVDRDANQKARQHVRTIAVNRGQEGTWRTALIVQPDEWEKRSKDGTLEAWLEAEADARWDQAPENPKNRPVTPPGPPPPLTVEERAGAVLGKKLEMLDANERIVTAISDHLRLTRELLELDSGASVPPLLIPTVSSDFDVIAERERVLAEIAELEAAKARDGGQ